MPLVASETGLTYLQVGLVNGWIVGGANDSVDLDLSGTRRCGFYTSPGEASCNPWICQS